jgi:diamine N-acetyltransferase
MPEPTVSLREITRETVGAIIRLSDTLPPEQQKMVAPNAVSIAQAHFEEHAWFRAIYAGDEPVGFIMLYADPGEPEYFLWRLMVAHPHQGKGYGRAALLQLIEHVRTLPGATELLTSYVPMPGGPGPFYEGLGFTPTGDLLGEEVVIRLPLR